MNINATPYSNLKIFAHPEKIESVKNGIRTSPIYVRIKPTNICNHKCYYCSYADSELGLRDNVKYRDSISYEKMKEIINDLGDMRVKAVTFSGGGEPLVYPHIEEAMELMLEKGIDISIITNGHLLSGKKAEILTKAKWVRISFDAADADTYSKIRGIPLKCFDEVCSNIKKFAEIKPRECELGVNFVINHMNYKQTYEMAKMLKNLGVNHIKFTARVTKNLNEYHNEFKNEAIDQIHKAINELQSDNFRVINKYEDDFKFCTVFKRCYSKCIIKELFTVIAADSKVYFCHDKAYVKSGIVGDLKNKSLKELWFSEEVNKKFEEFDAMKECKHHCVYDDRNILLNTFLDLDNNHINFI